jgi:Lrp/AsnC family transcriptional regulator for asnA, asnC and gidA
MQENYQIDKLDRQIMARLMEDARTPYLEMARDFIVSGGTIHQRISKLQKAGIITGSKIEVDWSKLGLDVKVILGVHLRSSQNLEEVISILKSFPEVVEINYTTGNFALFVTVMTKTIKEFHHFLVDNLQKMEAIQSTESFICLDVPLDREIDISN